MAIATAAQAKSTNRQAPWQEIGTDVSNLMTAEEALTAADLDWAVDLRPALVATEEGTIPVPGKRVALRTSDNFPLGVVGSAYQTLQNRDAFAFADSLVDDGSAKYERAGSFKEGRVVFLSMEIPQGVSVPGDESGYKPYILLANGHDGRRSLSVAVVTQRVYCENTLNMAIKGAQQRFDLRHSSGIDGRLQMAREALGLTFTYLSEFTRVATGLVNTKVTDKQVEKILARVFPIDAEAPDKVKEKNHAVRIFDNYRTSPNIADLRGTAWGVVNATTEYLDHVVEYRGRTNDPASIKAASLLLGGTGQRHVDSLMAALAKAR